MVARTFYDTVTAAVEDLAAHGYDSQERIDYWTAELRRVAEQSLPPWTDVERLVRERLTAVYARQVDRGSVLTRHAGVSRYTLDRLKPTLREELRRRTAANIDLIRLNRDEAVDRTVKRFRAWGTSLPPQPSAGADKAEEKRLLRKSLASLPYADRRLHIDQAAKLSAAISATVAVDAGALGAFWHSHKYQAGYRGRPTHNARDGKFFLMRDSWAQAKGFLKVGPNGNMDSIEQAAEWPFCRCTWSYVYAMRSVPRECVTVAGEAALREARAAVARMG